MEVKNNECTTNTGDENSGDWNSGNLNSGNLNSGNRNCGYWNSGNLNSGNRNSGNRNSGDWNSGDWNSGNRNSGNLNTTEPNLRIFNKETEIKRGAISYPEFFYFFLNKWVKENNMSNKEKKAYPSYVTTGGYLLVKSYKQAWRDSWDEASDEDRRKVLDLPNWNNEIFKEISGIDVEKLLNIPAKENNDQNSIIELNGKKYRLVEED